ncbi:MAG: hypothetical protein RJQ09_17015 [Cyclobacteriaceae bacterium]
MNDLTKKKNQLKAIESDLKEFIATDSTELETKLKDYLKTGAIVGGSLLVGFTVYRMLADEQPEKESKKKKKGSTSMWGIAKQRLTLALLTLAYRSIMSGSEDAEETQE